VLANSRGSGRSCGIGLLFIIYHQVLSTQCSLTEFFMLTDRSLLMQENTRVVTIDDYEDVPANSESSLKQAVSQQPVSVAIEADKRPFQFYRGVRCSGTSAPFLLVLEHVVCLCASCLC
jgi:hypothetical protein